MANLGLIAGRSGRPGTGKNAARLHDAVRVALAMGYMIGAKVLIGNVEGTVVGYNIASDGDYPGTTYPLLVDTRYGISKCALIEVSLE